jgi:threonine/homoserine/homoserine lactone efflux protein
MGVMVWAGSTSGSVLHLGTGGSSVLRLVVTGLVVMGSPGPSTVSLVAVSAAYGVRRTVAYGVGLVVGAIAVLLAVATGMTAVLLALPTVRWLLLALAVAYVLWLAVRLALSPTLGGDDAAAHTPSVRGGLVLGALNPKAWVAIGAVFLSARLAAAPMTDAIAKAVVLAMLIVIVHVAWLAAGRLLVPVLRTPRRARTANIALAGLLALAMVTVLLP